VGNVDLAGTVRQRIDQGQPQGLRFGARRDGAEQAGLLDRQGGVNLLPPLRGDRRHGDALEPARVAAIIIEPVQGEGGYVFAPDSFLRKLRALCDQYGIVLIFDEVQSGMGRTGKMWACEHPGVVPDILTCAKGIASGMPLGVAIARADVMNWGPGAHASTFGGNPVCCAAALETIRLLEEKYIANAAAMGEYIMQCISSWPKKHRIVGDVRGKGLMIGIELVKDQTTKEPYTECKHEIMDRAFHQGLAVLSCGESTIRLMPPLVVDREQCDFALEVLENCISEIEN